MEEQGSMLGKWLECALGEALSGSPPSCAENGEGEMQWDLERQPTKTRVFKTGRTEPKQRSHWTLV